MAPPSKPSLANEVFSVLLADLRSLPGYEARTSILCPMCLSDITLDELRVGGIEHIIPRNAVRDDPVDMRDIATQNQRCGITALCRTRRIHPGGADIAHGCNGWKGSKYDFAFRGLLDSEAHHADELSNRNAVGILLMAYLGAFQCLGYSYILQDTLGVIRSQFMEPDRVVTSWLDHALYCLPKPPSQIAHTSSGQPFLMGGMLTPDSPLEVTFRRCRALLPSGWRSANGVRTLSTLLNSGNHPQ